MSIKINRNLQTCELTDLTDEEQSIINKSNKCNVWRDEFGNYLLKHGTKDPLTNNYLGYIIQPNNVDDATGLAICTNPYYMGKPNQFMSTWFIINGVELNEETNQIKPTRQVIAFKNQNNEFNDSTALLVDNPVDRSFSPEQAELYGYRNCVVVANQSAQMIGEGTGYKIDSDNYIYKILCGVKSKSKDYLYHNEYVDPAAIIQSPSYVTCELSFTSDKNLIHNIFGTDVSSITTDTVEYSADITVSINMSEVDSNDSLKDALIKSLFTYSNSIMLPMKMWGNNGNKSVKDSGLVFITGDSDGISINTNGPNRISATYILWSDITVSIADYAPLS